MVLTQREFRILELERTWWMSDATKAEQVAETLDVSTTRYHELLDQLIDIPAALKHDPLLVLRLRRMRDGRRRSRRFAKSTIEEHA